MSDRQAVVVRLSMVRSRLFRMVALATAAFAGVERVFWGWPDDLVQRTVTTVVLLMLVREASRITVYPSGLVRGWRNKMRWTEIVNVAPPVWGSGIWQVHDHDRRLAVWHDIATSPRFRNALRRWAPTESPARKMLDVG